jgi:hypothetical protein
MRIVAILSCALLLIVSGSPPSHAEKRIALVIGNDRYLNLPTNGQLARAVNDARAVVFALQQPVHVTIAQLMLVPSTLR